MNKPTDTSSVAYRAYEGLQRVAVALRTSEWERAKAGNLNPTQTAILDVLEGRKSGLSVKKIAAELGISQPTATDSINALERKGLVLKSAGSADRRAVNVCISASGLEVRQAGAETGNVAQIAIQALGSSEQEGLLLTLVKMIKQLQDAGAIPVQRMCTTCRYFEPFAHGDTLRPHHCKLVDTAFGQADLRIDCREHDVAESQVQAEAWTRFQHGSISPAQTTASLERKQ